MSKSSMHPIDRDLWRRQKEAPQAEWWKWDWWQTWDPVFKLFYSGEKQLADLECPVCT